MFIDKIGEIFSSTDPRCVSCIGNSSDILDFLLPYLRQKLDYDDEHPDVIMIEPEHNSIKIDQIRNLLERLSIKPFYGTYYVIIPNAELLTANCYNALLKTLEESKNVWFFLLFINYDSMPPTIKSRSWHIKLSSEEDSNYLLLLDDIKNLSMNNIFSIADFWLEKVTITTLWLDMLWLAIAKLKKEKYLSSSLDNLTSLEDYSDYLLELKNNSIKQNLNLKRCIDQTLLRLLHI